MLVVRKGPYGVYDVVKLESPGQETGGMKRKLPSCSPGAVLIKILYLGHALGA